MRQDPVKTFIVPDLVVVLASKMLKPEEYETSIEGCWNNAIGFILEAEAESFVIICT